MRLAVFTSLADTWARETIMVLAKAGHEVHVIDFGKKPKDYLTLPECKQPYSLDLLRGSIAGLHLLQTPISSNLRYILAVPELRFGVRAVQRRKCF